MTNLIKQDGFLLESYNFQIRLYYDLDAQLPTWSPNIEMPPLNSKNVNNEEKKEILIYFKENISNLINKIFKKHTKLKLDMNIKYNTDIGLYLSINYKFYWSKQQLDENIIYYYNDNNILYVDMDDWWEEFYSNSNEYSIFKWKNGAFLFSYGGYNGFLRDLDIEYPNTIWNYE